MSEELNQTFMDFGALGYDEDRMISILGKSKKEFGILWLEYSKTYQRGADDFEFAVDRKLMQLAANGDMKAMDKINIKKLDYKNSKILKNKR
jgi:hypothetical protein